MKTFRQQLRNWLKDKKNSTKSPEENNLFEEILVKINELESVEADNINRAYQKGHIDSEKGKNPLSNYYKTTHKSNSQLRAMIKK
jgi:hypothetical protein